MTTRNHDIATGRRWIAYTVPRNSHQLASVVLLSGFSVSGVLAVVAPADGSTLELFRHAGFFLAFLAFLYMKCTRFGLLAEADVKDLDERERWLRDRADVVALRIVYGLLFGLLIILFLADLLQMSGHKVGVDQLLDILLYLCLTVASLPGIVLAWTTPDPVPEDDA